jgi:hypothetical protein
MCGSVSAIGLNDEERAQWPHLKERLRVPGHFMALMRGLLGEVELAVVAAVTADGYAKPQAILANAPELRAEITLVGEEGPIGADGLAMRAGKIAEDPIQVITEPDGQGGRRILAVLATPWIDQHLLVYARNLWYRRTPRR